MSPTPSPQEKFLVCSDRSDSWTDPHRKRDKPSLRGKPVIVGGIAGRGVVATASYEARRFGARSAMPTSEARRRCPPGTAFLTPRFAAYRKTSEVVMALLHELSPLVEQVSIDEAYIDLAAGDHDLSPASVTVLAEQIRASIAAATGGVTASVGVGTSKLVAKIGSDLHKPNGLTIAAAGGEQALLHPLPVTRLPGVGPATTERLRRAGIHTIGALAQTPLPQLLDWFGQAHGGGLYRLARADDDRPVISEREAKSVSAEETFDVDLTDRARLGTEIDLLATKVGGRLRDGGLSARTVTIKVRHHDFTTITRSTTRPQPTDQPKLIAQLARRLLSEVDTSAGIRLLGVGVTALADFVQDDLFGAIEPDRPSGPVAPDPGLSTPDQHTVSRRTTPSVWRAGQDILHSLHGPGWVWGAGRGLVTVRFEGPTTGPGPIRTFAAEDPNLLAADPPNWA
ncbi:DNA polymerase IV [Actinoplanes sp. NPDC051411]|uniref:DNA polymerase IV n=1 Tax=Actinoplanes sp. NPDC051411 TaxID=3155522 RepID=UPI00342C8919